ncbi:MAG: NAD-dependent malic enzyme [Thermotoga sp. 4484_232]|nr:MAG: NAD-dependent malic enzyme [Thermotoga sp. 4484_232]
MNIYEKALKIHRDLRGKIEIHVKEHVSTREKLSMLYTPGVAEVAKKIHENELLVNELTMRWNFVAIISDGSAVLGLGNVGPYAAMPVMEGKALLFKEFGGVDAIPLCISTRDVDEIVKFCLMISPTFGGINFEDISAPRCFEIEEKLRGKIDIPIFHDDQHGTAIVVGAALLNALKIVNKRLSQIKVVINGIGAAGTAIARFLLRMGVGEMLLCDRNGILNPYDKRTILHKYHLELASRTNPEGISGDLAKAMEGADVFIGVSRGNLVTGDMIRRMAEDPIVFAMANPTPEIFPDEAKANGARIVATGRSDYPNQVNNVLAFPGVFRGALDIWAREINEQMKIDASRALADYWEDCLREDSILPPAMDKHVVVEVALATAKSAIKSGVARKIMKEEDLKRAIEERILESGN